MPTRASITFSFGAAAVVASAFVWIACSSTPSSIIGQDGGGGSGSGSGSSSGGSSSGAGSSGGSGSGSSSGASSSGSSSGASSSGSSSGGIVDAGPATCPAVPCTGGQICCADISNASAACAATCGDADVIGCTGPANCTGSAAGAECCATAQLANNPDGAAFPNCSIASLTSFCGAKCTNQIGLTCTSAEQLHVCTATSDCATDNGNNLCCAVDGYHICTNSLVKGVGGLTCLP